MMNHSPPQIGFDRFVQLDWARLALRIRAGNSSMDELDDLLAASHAGQAAIKKTRTVLNRLWLEPRAELVDFADRGVEIYGGMPDDSAAALTWGMALATYPFFGKVAEIVGRLTAIQGDCTSAEVHRRMAEVYGEREGTRRMTNMVLQSQASWGCIERTDKGKRIERKRPMDLQGSDVAVWLAEACLRYNGRALSVASLQANPATYPFILGNAAAYRISESQFFELRLDGSGSQVVELVA